MKGVNKSLIKLLVFIALFGLVLISATYAYLKVNIKEKGQGINIETKGVDTFQIVHEKDANIDVNFNNFRYGYGHDVSSDATISLKLLTTNNETKVCYKTYLSLPSNQVFSYSSDVPELVITVNKLSFDNVQTTLLNNLDITTKTGIYNIPVSEASDNYIHVINGQKNKEVIEKINASVTFKYFADVNQAINNGKSYSAKIEVKVVDCITGEEIANN